MEKIRVGIIGTGSTIGIAKQHVNAYKENARVELTALYDIVPGRSQEWAKKQEVENVVFCSSLEELFENVDAVSICTPNFTHVDLTIKAIEAGKHVICEKPFATSAEEAKRAVEVAKKHPKIVVMVCFNYREIPHYKYIKHIIDEGKIGSVYTMRQEIGGNRIADSNKVELEWRMQESLSGAGSLADFGCHMLDLADFILSSDNGPICEVQAMVNTFIAPRKIIGEDGMGKVTNDDCAVFNARTEKGTLLSFVSSRIGLPNSMMEIVGEGGMIIMDGTKGEIKVWLKEKQGSYIPKNRETVQIPDEFKGEEGHKGIINRFVECILDGKTDDRDLERGLYIQHLLDQLKNSAQEGKTIKV